MPTEADALGVEVAPAGTPPIPQSVRVPSPLPPHLVVLDGVRGLAILLVLTSHFAADLDLTDARVAPLVRVAVDAGWIGVDLFFALSGFLITNILWKNKERHHYFLNFYVRRTLRTLPLYYGMLVLSLIIAPVLGRPGIRSAIGPDQAYFWLYGVNLLILTKGLMPPLGHFWSLAVEEHFYLVWPVVMRRASLQRAGVICLCIIIGAFLTRLVMSRCTSPLGIYVFTLSRMDSIACGAMVALVSQASGVFQRFRQYQLIIVTLFAVPLGILILGKGGLPQFDPVVQLWGYSLIASLSACFVVIMASIEAGGHHSWWSDFFCSKFMVALGKYSYGMYVLHPFVMSFLSRLVPSHRPGASWQLLSLGIALYLFSGIALSQAAAYISWHLYEKHFLKLKRRFEH